MLDSTGPNPILLKYTNNSPKYNSIQEKNTNNTAITYMQELITRLILVKKIYLIIKIYLLSLCPEQDNRHNRFIQKRRFTIAYEKINHTRRHVSRLPREKHLGKIM